MLPENGVGSFSSTNHASWCHAFLLFLLLLLTPSGTSLEVQWLGPHASTAGGVGSISSWGTNILHAACPPPTPSKGRFPIAGDFWRHEEVTPSPCHQIPLILCLELPCGVLVEVFLHHRPSAHLDGRFQNLLTRACLHRHERSSSLTSHADFLVSEFLSFSVQWILRIILY